jgi:hypothetical protein
LRYSRLAQISTRVQVRGISENANTFQNRISALSDAASAQPGPLISPRHQIGIWNAHFALSASADVQTLVELLIKLLLLPYAQALPDSIAGDDFTRKRDAAASAR